MDLIQPFGAILLVMGLLGAALFALKRRGMASFTAVRPAGARRLEAMERIPLGAQHALHLVRVGDRCVLIATAPSSCQLLDVNVPAEGKS